MSGTTQPHASLAEKDWVRQPPAALFWWGLPVAIGIAAGFLHLPFRVGAGLWTVLLAWMATGCVLNAWRCRRLHCYISGLVMTLGAVFAALVAVGALDVRPAVFSEGVNAALLLAMLSIVVDFVWKRYA